MPASKTQLLELGATLVLDSLTANIVGELERRGVRAIVLKGPALGRLYGDTPRTHEDIDLLVPPSALTTAERVLRGAGFEFAAESLHARAWIREADGVTVDLHRTLAGIGASHERTWEVLGGHAVEIPVGGSALEALDPAGIALHAALHAAQHGARAGKAAEDLRRAVDQLDDDTWLTAVGMARELDALPALAAGLRMLPPGQLLAERLQLPTQSRVDLALGVGSPPVTSRGLYRLATTHGLRGKLALISAELAPPPTFMRAVYPIARRGRLGLAAGYAWRPLWLLWHAVPALRALHRARKTLR